MRSMIENVEMSKIRARPGFNHKNLLLLNDILFIHRIAYTIAHSIVHSIGSSMTSVALVVVDRSRCGVAEVRV